MGDYSYSVFRGVMTALVSNSNITVDLTLQKDGDFPSSMAFSTCGTSLLVDMSFTGNVGASVLNALSAAVEAAIKKVVDVIVCDKVASMVAVNGTAALVQVIDPALQRIIASQPSAVPSLPFAALDWHESVLGLMYKWLGSGLANKMRGCVLERFPELSAPWINEIVDVISDGSGVISVVLDAVLPVRNGTFTVNSASVVGLDSFGAIELFKPSDTSNVSLVTSLSLERLELVLNTTVASAPSQHYSEDIVFKLTLSNVTALLEVAVAVNQSQVGAYFLDQLALSQSRGCFVQSLGYVNISSLAVDVSIDQIALSQVSGGAASIEQDIAALLDNFLELLTQGFGDLVADVVGGLFQGPIRQQLNSRITSSLEAKKLNSTCPTHTAPTPTPPASYIVWQNSTVIRAIDAIVNDKIGADGLNQIMDCVTDGTGTLDISLQWLDVHVGGLDSFFNVSVLAPVSSDRQQQQPYTLLNSLGIGRCQQASCKPFSLKVSAPSSEGASLVQSWLSDVSSVFTASASASASAVVDLSASDVLAEYLAEYLTDGQGSSSVSSVFPPGSSLSVRFENLFVFVDLMAAMDGTDLAALQVSQLRVHGCVGSTVDAASVEALQLQVSNASLVVNDGVLGRDMTALFSKWLERLSSPQKIDKYNARIDSRLADSGTMCENGGVMPNVVTDDDVGGAGAAELLSAWQIGVVAASAATVCLLAVVSTAWYRKNSSSSSSKDNEVDDAAESDKMLKQSLLESALDADSSSSSSDSSSSSFFERWGFGDAMICQEKIPLWLRVSMVVVGLGNTGFFFHSNTDVNGIFIIADIFMGQKTYSIDPVFVFGYAQSVQDSELLSSPKSHSPFT